MVALLSTMACQGVNNNTRARTHTSHGCCIVVRNVTQGGLAWRPSTNTSTFHDPPRRLFSFWHKVSTRRRPVQLSIWSIRVFLSFFFFLPSGPGTMSHKKSLVPVHRQRLDMLPTYLGRTRRRVWRKVAIRTRQSPSGMWLGM